MAEFNEKIIEVKDLTISFKTDHGVLKAVRGVSFDLYKGETLCIVGESGSGKSVTSKAIMGILAANAIVEDGSIYYRGEDLLQVAEEQFHKIRGHKIGMIFQDPLSSLNPIVRIGKQITEATLINSNKLKLLYEDTISEELIAYKNCIARYKNAVSHQKLKQEQFLAEKKAALKHATPEEKEQLKKEIADFKAITKLNIGRLKEKHAEELPPLKDALNAKKKEAKVLVKEHHKKVLEEYERKMEAENLRYQGALATCDESKKAVIQKEHKEKVAQIQKEKVDQLRITKAEAKRRALEIMREVGIPEPERRYKQYPFEFSGGMRQRIVIAIALTETPEILICDEPTTALDVTIQGQILELIKRIQKERNLSCIFITHDLGVVANMADRVAVMYAGKIVEYGTAEEVFFDPRHPYTWALLSSIPDIDSKERLDAIPG
ncbi:MAG: ATP-binding cassette domain-containing protein, partial [Bacilli bacterium]|nr:ATP-binding cassette domain-containing protein [Bacilli bacterium]